MIEFQANSVTHLTHPEAKVNCKSLASVLGDMRPIKLLFISKLCLVSSTIVIESHKPALDYFKAHNKSLSSKQLNEYFDLLNDYEGCRIGQQNSITYI